MPAEAEEFRGDGPVAAGQGQGGLDVMPLHHPDRLVYQFAQGRLAHLLDQEIQPLAGATGAGLGGEAAADVPHRDPDMAGVQGVVACGGDLHLDLRALLAMERGREEAHRPEAQDIGQQHGQVRARAAEPTPEGLAKQGGLGTHLDHVEKGPIGAQDHALVVDDHVGVRAPLDQVLQGKAPIMLLGEGRSPGGREVDDKNILIGGGHERGVGGPGLTIRTQPQDDVLALAPIPQFPQHAVEGLAVLGNQGVEKLALVRRARPRGRQSQDLKRPGVEVDDAQALGIQEQDGLAGGIEQQAVAGLDLAQLPVIPLQGLLRLDQAVLEFGDGAQALADRQQAMVIVEADGGVFDRRLGAARQALHDLTEGGNPLIPGILEDAGEVNLIRGADCVTPGHPDPVSGLLAGKSIRKAGLLDEALPVQDELDVRR